MSQFPNAFEFNEEYLVFLANHVYSGLFGTFLYNCFQERIIAHQCDRKTTSVWTYLIKYKASYTNPFFEELNGALWPSTSPKKIKLWERFFLRDDADMHPRPAR